MKIRTLLLSGLCILQLSVISAQVYRYQNVVNQGTPYRFLTRIVDPYDALRGKYITLEFAAEDFSTTHPDINLWDTQQPLYAIVQNNKQGFAQISRVQTTKPADKHNYLQIDTWWASYTDEAGLTTTTTLRLNFPMTRFYLKEDLAPQAEQRYNEASLDENPYNSYAVVYLLNGKAVIDDVKINEQSVKASIK